MPDSQCAPVCRSGAEGEGKMTANALPTIFTIEIGDTPTLTFEVQNLRVAHKRQMGGVLHA
jgi:hypothetical protein